MRTSKPHKKKLQGAETKKKLYESATKLFLQHDFSNVAVEDITDAVGVTKGTFYVHFASKDALIAEFIADYAKRTDWDYKMFLDALPSDKSASERLIALIEKISDVLVGTIGYHNMCKVYQIMLTGSVETEAVKGYGRMLYGLFHDILDQGIQSGEFKTAMSLDMLTRLCVTAIRGVCFDWCIRSPTQDLKEEAIAHFNLLLAGITSTK